MSTGAAHRQPMTLPEYRAMERASAEKHILWNGEVFAMAGASVIHDELVGSILEHVRVALRGQPCRGLPSDLRVWVPARSGYVYPDVTVACPPLDLELVDGLETLRNPRTIFEVVSESTEAFDRGDKFAGYRSIESLTDYVLVSTTSRSVDHFTRQLGGTWLLRAHAASDTLALPSLGIELPLDALYAAAFPADPAARST